MSDFADKLQTEVVIVDPKSFTNYTSVILASRQVAFSYVTANHSGKLVVTSNLWDVDWAAM